MYLLQHHTGGYLGDTQTYDDARAAYIAAQDLAEEYRGDGFTVTGNSLDGYEAVDPESIAGLPVLIYVEPQTE